MFSAALKSGAAATTPTDPQFNYVTMLLHGDGTNGGQNNTFLDSSTNNFTITRNGNTTQGSFSPYGSNWSNYFDGTGDYLTTPSAFAIGSNDFTYEVFLFATSFPGYTQKIVTGSGNNLNFTLTGTGDVKFYDGTGNYTCGTIALNTWNHVAVSRVGGTLNLYVNGTRNYSSSNAASQSAQILYIGAESGGTSGYFGYISNLRLIVGTGLYSAATITVPTSALTAVSGTQLLTCQANRFIDSSSNNYSITVNGNTSVQRFSPFAPSAAYSTATIGGSGYFDGSGDYLKSASSASLSPGSGALTLDCWIYMTATGSGNKGILTIGNANSTGNALQFIQNGTTLYINDGSGSNVTLGTIPLNAWTHIALSREGTGTNQTYGYINGVKVATTTYSSTFSSPMSAKVGTTEYGSGAGSEIFTGYISDARVIIGTALYTGATYTVPAAPVSAVSNTQFLSSMTNGSIFDNAMMNDLETVGNAQISTSVKKYGTGSMYFDGTGDGLRGVPNLPQNQFGTGDFTVECWLYQTATNTYPSIVEIGNHVAAGGILFIGSNGSTITAYSASYGGFMGTATAPSLNTWNHIAWVRYNGIFKIYVNGVGNSGVSASTDFNSSSTFTIGAEQSFNAGYTYTGYIDDLRITKGYARYTANFTPPTAAFPNN